MTALQVSAQKQLRQLVEQIERLEEEKKALAGDIRDKYLEAKAVGFDTKALRKIVSLRKKSDRRKTAGPLCASRTPRWAAPSSPATAGRTWIPATASTRTSAAKPALRSPRPPAANSSAASSPSTSTLRTRRRKAGKP